MSQIRTGSAESSYQNASSECVRTRACVFVCEKVREMKKLSGVIKNHLGFEREKPGPTLFPIPWDCIKILRAHLCINCIKWTCFFSLRAIHRTYVPTVCWFSLFLSVDSFLCFSAFFMVRLFMSGFDSILGHKSSLTISLQHFYYIHSKSVWFEMGYFGVVVVFSPLIHIIMHICWKWSGTHGIMLFKLCWYVSVCWWVSASVNVCGVDIAWFLNISIYLVLFLLFFVHGIVSFMLLHAHTC